LPDRPTLFWFRDDLRLADNPGLAAAQGSGQPVILAYILDDLSPGVRPIGAASRWWLDKSLRALGERIAAKGGRLILRRGAARTELANLVVETNASAVRWSRRYGPAREIDARIEADMTAGGVRVETFNASLLVEPVQMTAASGAGYKVFTPFWRALQARIDLSPHAIEPGKFATTDPSLRSDALDSWELHPVNPDWSASIAEAFEPGELAARRRLRTFLGTIDGYAESRNRPDLSGVSRLSPHLRFGEIGPADVWRAAKAAEEAENADPADIAKFLSELGWRDFSHHLLYHDPEMSRLCWRRDFEDMAWRTPAPADLSAWKEGRTGYPIVDAGMRQLWATGWMHNRVRMITASFLTKDLLAHWRIGEEWFWDTLVDADEANNAAGWQWVAGTGADASPYFRVFNPSLQGETFDPEGEYVRSWVPELAGLPSKFIHRPWEASAPVLAQAGVELGATYPRPIIDHAFARRRALGVYGVAGKGFSLEGKLH